MDLSVPDARSLSDEILEALRLRALRGCALGLCEADVAFLLGVSRETVSRWWSAYSTAGVDALPGQRTGRPVGSGRTLSAAQAVGVCEQIDRYTPEQLGIPSPLWNRRAVRALIDKEYGIRMPVRTVGEYLKRWGYTAKKPRRHARDQDSEEVRRWLQEDYPALRQRARQEGAEIHWCDETGVAADEHPGGGYAREGQPAAMEVPDKHIRVNRIAAISNEGAVHFLTYKSALDADLFLVFLGHLVRTTSRKVILILDRLRAHEAASVKDWVAEHKGRIELVYLPRRAPEVNPDEYLNNDLKGGVNQDGLPNSSEALRARIEAFMRRLSHWPAHVISYFHHPCVQYAAY